MTEEFYPAPNVRELELPTESALTELLSGGKTVDLLFLLGNIRLRNGDFLGAVSSYREALSLKLANEEKVLPEQIECNLAIALFRMGNASEALTTLRPLTLKYPELSLAHLLLGKILWSEGNSEGAMQSFEKALRADERCAEALFALGLIAEEQNRLEKAVQYYERALVIEPNHEAVKLRLGEHLFREGLERFQVGDHFAAFRMWAQLQRRYPTTFFQVQEVVAAFKKAITIFRSENVLGTFLHQYEESYRNHHGEAEALFHLTAAFLFTHHLFPECYEDDLAKAQAHWEEELCTFGEHPYPHFRLGVIALYRGAFEEARDQLRWCQDHLPPKKQEALKIQTILDFVFSLTELQRNVDNNRLSSAGLSVWEECGFTDPFQQRVWRETGLEPLAAAEWRAKGISPKQAGDWFRAKVPLEEAILWQANGFSDPESARLWIRGGFHPSEAREWQEHFPLSVEETIRWRRGGFFDPKRAREWSLIFEFPWTASQWQELGFEPLDALSWSELGFKDPFVASAWQKRGFTPEGALQQFVISGESELDSVQSQQEPVSEDAGSEKESEPH